MKVVSFIEPRAPERSDGRADVIEAILTHCGLWQARSARAPPEVDELVLELDAAYVNTSIDTPEEADESQELAYVDIDTLPGELLIIPDAGRHEDAAIYSPAVGSTRILPSSTCILCSGRPQFRSLSQKSASGAGF